MQICMDVLRRKSDFQYTVWIESRRPALNKVIGDTVVLLELCIHLGSRGEGYAERKR